MENLTSKQKNFFEKLKEKYTRFALPSYEKIALALGYKSKNSIKQYMEILKKEHLIFESEGFSYIDPSQFGAYLLSSYVKAGFASIMDDKIEKRLSLDDIFNINSPSTFVFKVSGNSMCDIGIFDGDYVMIKKTPEAKVGDVVLAIIDQEFTLKTYRRDSKGAYLEPQNKEYPILRPKESLSIFGVALGIARQIHS